MKRNTISTSRDLKEAVLEIPEHKADAKDRAAQTREPVCLLVSRLKSHKTTILSSRADQSHGLMLGQFGI